MLASDKGGRTVNGRPTGLCRYPIDIRALGDPSKGCAKSFRVRFACSDGSSELTKEHRVEPEALGRYALLQCVGATDAIRSTDFDRSGSDFRNFEVTDNDPTPCQNACLGDARCRAWTFVKPGVQGAAGRCWLKSAVAVSAARPWRVSGVIR